MSFKCPHCSESIENAMSAETHRERLKAKDEENKSLKTELTEAQKKAKGYDVVVKERDEFKTELGKRDAAVERGTAFAEAGIPEKVRSGFEAMFNSAVASAEEGKEPTFKDWLNSEDAKTHPLLAGHYGTPAGEPEKSPAGDKKPPAGDKKPPAGDKKTGLLNTDRNTGAPPNGKNIDSPAKLQAYLGSAEYRALSREEQKKELGALQSQITDGMDG